MPRNGAGVTPHQLRLVAQSALVITLMLAFFSVFAHFLCFAGRIIELVKPLVPFLPEVQAPSQAEKQRVGFKVICVQGIAGSQQPPVSAHATAMDEACTLRELRSKRLAVIAVTVLYVVPALLLLWIEFFRDEF